jgi:hypothetical protein
MQTREWHNGITAEEVSKKWGIGLEAAQHPIKVMTQQDISTMLNPSLSQQFPTNDWELRYGHLPVDLFKDTMKSTVTSRHGIQCAQVCSASNGWVKAYPMKQRFQAHETFGVPTLLIMDGAQEQMMGELQWKCREVRMHTRRET